MAGPETVSTGFGDTPTAPMAGAAAPPDEYSTPIPAGATTTAPTPPPPADEYSTPIPQGATSTPPPPAFGQGQAPIDTSDQGSLWSQAGHQVAAVGAGVGHGLLDTLSGAAGLVGADGLKSQFDQGRAELDKDNAGNKDLNSIGYGGESLAEFMLGDEALKGLSFADKLMTVSKVAKVLEKSPRLMQALKIGTNAGLVQGTQTALRTDGSVGHRLVEGAKSAAVAAPTAGILGLGAGKLSELVSGAGDTAGKVPNLEKVAANAPGKEATAVGLSKRIGDAEEQLHAHYDTGIEDLKARLGGATISAQDNPIAKRAQKLLDEPDPAEHPSNVVGIKSAGEGMDKATRDYLQTLADGNDPAAEAVRDAKAEEKKPEVRLYGANDKPLPKIEPEEPEQIDARPYDIDSLIKMRQNIRVQANKWQDEPGNINARALRSLLWDPETQSSAVDDTIGKLADQSGDADAKQDYSDLRQHYRDHINDYDDPLIKNIRAGKLDDAAKAFVGVQRSGSALPSAGKVRYNTELLGRILGPDGLHKFGKEVFQNMMADSTENGRINPAKFTDTWKRVTGETKSDLFDMQDAANGLAKLAKDTQSAATLQHLTRVGLLGAAGTAAGGVLGPFVPHVGAGIGTILGLTVAEGGGLAAGRTLLDWVATHPNTWSAYAKAGKFVAPTLKKGLAPIAYGTAVQGADGLRKALSGAQGLR